MTDSTDDMEHGCTFENYLDNYYDNLYVAIEKISKLNSYDFESFKQAFYAARKIATEALEEGEEYEFW